MSDDMFALSVMTQECYSEGLSVNYNASKNIWLNVPRYGTCKSASKDRKSFVGHYFLFDKLARNDHVGMRSLMGEQLKT